jgi:acetyltransferase-like isoleucine patch superfamily enzyme
MIRAEWVMPGLPFGIPTHINLKRLISLSRVRPLWAVLQIELGAEVELEGAVWIPGPGRVHLGRGVRLRARRAPIELRAHEGAEIWLGDGVVVEAGASIEATGRVEVGARASIGAFSKLIDNHYHRTVGDRTERPPPVPIFVGEDAIIGPRAILLPGARVAARGMVGAGQVLSSRQEALPSSRESRTDDRRVA